MVLFSQQLLDNLGKIDDALLSVNKSDWWQDTVSVSTWSDRLRGYNRLKNPEAWSLFGKEIEGGYLNSDGTLNLKSKDYSHDMINAGLKNVGGVGVFFITVILVISMFKLHDLVLKLPPGPAQEFATMGISFSLLKVALSVAGGGNFNVAPTATFTWLFFAAIVMAGRGVTLIDKKKDVEEVEEEDIPSSVVRIDKPRFS